ncbi:hypothetical protein SAMN07250955_105119 [Arboricoccus pini]|uniref:Uncharacterized protein n=1 Tax=Arboricoccus pini TaxID=1963835 RepID=A0A212R3J0_9PROT|nr:hypothetical protein SAMN07250955_105119 [Arboricoccus pini]
MLLSVKKPKNSSYGAPKNPFLRFSVFIVAKIQHFRVVTDGRESVTFRCLRFFMQNSCHEVARPRDQPIGGGIVSGGQGRLWIEFRQDFACQGLA